MTAPFTIGSVHHLRLTVTDVERSRAFYIRQLGFEVAMEFPTGVLLSNGRMWLGIGPAPNPTAAPAGDRFDPNRVGLDHLSFGVTSRAELEAAKRAFQEHGVPHDEVRDLGPDLGISVLTFEDPDGIQLELTAPNG